MTLRVNHASLETAAASLSRIRTQLEQDLDKLAQQITKCKEHWEGDAKITFNQAEIRWKKQANDIKAILSDASKRVNEANTAYREADRRGGDRFKG